MLKDVLEKFTIELKEWIYGEKVGFIPSNEKAKFQLRYHKLVIGFLTYDSGVWRFEYSDQFKAQLEIDPLISFPDQEKVYESQILFPFFMSRIPSLKQPKVQQILKDEHIDEVNELNLLKRFGYETISNPYLLTQ